MSTQSQVAAASVALVGTDRPLSQAFLRELAARCPTVYCGEPAAVGVRGLDLQRAPDEVPVVALLTWMDILADGDAVSRRLSQQMTSLRRLPAGSGQVVLCVVPYGSYFDDGRWQHELLLAAAARDSQHVVETVVAALRQHAATVRTVFTPMVLWRDADEWSGHPSAAQKLLRVARCLGEETVSKAPTYFSQYSLNVLQDGTGVLNCAPCPAVVDALLATIRDDDAGRDASEPLHLSSPISWSDFAAAANRTGVVRIARVGSRDECNALDDSFNDLLSEEPGTRRHVVTYSGAGTLHHPVSTTGLRSAIADVAHAPRQPWEDSYVLVREIDASVDITLPARHEAVASSIGAPRTVTYHCGGTGTAVVVVVPLGVDAAYFAQVIEPLRARHRVILWYASGATVDQVARDVADLRECLPREGVDAFHLVTVCGGMRLVARLAVECRSQVRSLVLFAPFLDTTDEQTDGYRSLARFWERFAVGPGTTAERAEQARQEWRAQLTSAPSKLEQYGSRAQMRSPLRYHPTGFVSKGMEELYGNAGLFVRLLGMARTDESAEMLRLTRQDIAAYDRPVLVVAGTDDALVGYASARRRCQERAAWTLATVVGGNHYAVLEHGPTLGRLLAQFFRDGQLTVSAVDRVRGTRLRLSSGRETT